MPTEDAEAGEALRAEVETAFDISSTALSGAGGGEETTAPRRNYCSEETTAVKTTALYEALQQKSTQPWPSALHPLPLATHVGNPFAIS